METSSEPNSNRQALRTTAIKSFFAVLTTTMLLDALPSGVLPSDRPKELASEITTRAGIWQRQWKMFVPTPIVSNRWLSASICDSDGNEVDYWSSPYWADEPGVRKFTQIRHMNYFNRLSLSKNRAASRDFADYLARQAQEQHTATKPFTITLHSNQFQLVAPKSERFPQPEELVWVTQSRLLIDTRQREEASFEFEPLWPQPEAP